MSSSGLSASLVVAVVVVLLIQCDPTSARQYELRSIDRQEEISNFMFAAGPLLAEVSPSELEGIVDNFPKCASKSAEELQEAFDAALEKSQSRRSSTLLLRRLFEDLKNEHGWEKRNFEQNYGTVLKYLQAIVEQLPNDELAAWAAWATQLREQGRQGSLRFVQVLVDVTQSCAYRK